MKKFDFSKLTKKDIGIAAGVFAAVVGAGVTAVALTARHKKKKQEQKVELLTGSQQMEQEPEEEISVDFNYAKETILTFGQCYDLALEVAKELYGDKAFIVPASEQKALYINIDGQQRACFMFGADTTDNLDGTMRSLYHVDANTGEVFDNGSGDMQKMR